MYRKDYNDYGYERDDLPRENPRVEFDREFGNDEGYHYTWCSIDGRVTEHGTHEGCLECDRNKNK